MRKKKKERGGKGDKMGGKMGNTKNDGKMGETKQENKRRKKKATTT